MMRHIILRSLIIACTVFLLAGCGGGSTQQVNQSSATMGQELIDLEESYKQGIITEKEYKKAKEDILDRYN